MWSLCNVAAAPIPLPADDDYPPPGEDDGAGGALNFRVLLPIVLCAATVAMLGYAGLHIGKRSTFSSFSTTSTSDLTFCIETAVLFFPQSCARARRSGSRSLAGPSSAAPACRCAAARAPSGSRLAWRSCRTNRTGTSTT